MGYQTYNIPGFQVGEVSRKFWARTDLPAYAQACKILKNAIPLPTGPATRRPGTVYHATNNNSFVRLIPFKISATESLIVAIGTTSTVVYYPPSLGGGIITVTSGHPYTTEDELKVLDYVQNDQSLIIVNPSRRPRTFTRTPGSPDTWAYATPTYTITSGSETLGFTTFDSAGNFPSCVELFQSRLIFAATNNAPGRFWASKVGSLTAFTISTPVVADDAWTYEPQPNKRPTIVWLVAEDVLTFATEEGPFIVGARGQPLVATALTWWPQQQGSSGSAKVKPVIAEDSILYVQRGRNKVLSFNYVEAQGRWSSVDLNSIAENILQAKVQEGRATLAFQTSPESILWVIGSDGNLYSCTLSKTLGTVAWARHDLGGVVQSVVVVPTSTDDRVWISIRRGSQTVIEYLSPMKDETCYTDMTISVDMGPEKSVTSVTRAIPGVVTVPSHGYENGEIVRLIGVANMELLADSVYKVANKTTDTFELQYVASSTPVDTTGFPAGGVGGVCKKVTNTLSSLPYPNGAIVQVSVDGAYVDDEVVTGGVVTSPAYGRKISVGYKYKTIVQPLDLPMYQNRIKRIIRLWARFLDSYGCYAGPDQDNLQELVFKQGLITMDYPPEIVTDLIGIWNIASPDYKGTIYFETEIPLPFTILSVLAEYEVN